MLYSSPLLAILESNKCAIAVDIIINGSKTSEFAASFHKSLDMNMKANMFLGLSLEHLRYTQIMRFARLSSV